jgi:hypothetical protein
MSKFKVGDEVQAINDEYWDGLKEFTSSRLKVKGIFPNPVKEDCILCDCLDYEKRELFGPASKFKRCYKPTE